MANVKKIKQLLEDHRIYEQFVNILNEKASKYEVQRREDAARQATASAENAATSADNMKKFGKSTTSEVNSARNRASRAHSAAARAWNKVLNADKNHREARQKIAYHIHKSKDYTAY